MRSSEIPTQAAKSIFISQCHHPKTPWHQLLSSQTPSPPPSPQPFTLPSCSQKGLKSAPPSPYPKSQVQREANWIKLGHLEVKQHQTPKSGSHVLHVPAIGWSTAMGWTYQKIAGLRTPKRPKPAMSTACNCPNLCGKFL